MRVKYPYLTDSNFLNIVDRQRIKQYYVKITILDWHENPIQDIQGKITSGNITIDGSSSIRRTASLTFVAQDTDNVLDVENLISINKKIYMQIGFINMTNLYTDYKIIYFPLGYYVIINPSITQDQNGVTISLQLKDKMCLLNGQCGGTLPAAVVFDNYETIDENGDYVVERPTIYQIIRQLVNHFGGEQLGKIIISDLDTRVKQVMQWTSSSPLYFVQKNAQYEITVSSDYYQELLDDGWSDVLGSPFDYGSDVGYIYTDFTFPGDLIGDIGQSVTNILDKIIGVLGNYEYFYDVNGNFIFQEIKNYLNNSQTKYILDEANNNILVADYIANLRQFGGLFSEDYLLDMSKGKSVYNFDDSTLIQSYSNTPFYEDIKNDFVIWGLRTTSTGTEIPIRYHLAIDKKPKTGNIYKVFAYTDPQTGLTGYHCPIGFASQSHFPKKGAAGAFYLDKSTGKIYEWKENAAGAYVYTQIGSQMIQVKTKDWRTQLYLQGVAAEPYGTDSNYYYTELKEEWPKLFTLKKVGDYYEDQMQDYVTKNPEELDFFLDFIDTSSKISQFQVNNIGRRTKTLSEDKNVNCIFQPQIPDIILLPRTSSSDASSEMGKMRQEADQRGQTWWQVDDSIFNSLSLGGMFNSGYQIIRQLLHQYTSYNESVTLTCLPIYYLEPNTRIHIQNPKSLIYGDYMIKSLSFSFDNGGLMTINTTKAFEKI